MELYARRTSSNSQKVLWFLGELGLAYQLVPTGGDHGGLDAPEYRAMNPNGTVPTLRDDELAVWESHAILRYLAAAYGGERWWPAGAAARSQVERWMDWSQSGFDAAFMSLFWGHWRTPEADRREDVNRFQIGRCQRFLQVLDGVLAGRAFVAGPQLTLADIPVGALLYRYANLGVTEPLPRHVARWYEALCEREPYRDHVMLPFDELKGRLRP